MGKYRTYIRVFRVKPEISSMGLGPKRVRLPLGATITLDIIFVFIVTLPIARFTLAPLMAMVIKVPPDWTTWVKWLYAIFIAGTAAFFSRKFEPSGKTLFQFASSLFGFTMRNRWHDGWKEKKFELYEGNGFEIGFSQVNDDACGTLPASGFVDAFELKTPAAVTIKGNRIVFDKKGTRLPAGDYQFVNGKITVLQKQAVPPKIKRAPTLKRKGGKNAP